MAVILTLSSPILLASLYGLALVFILLLLTPFFVVKRKEVETSRLPHGTMGWPFIGETFGFLKPHKSDSIGSFLQQHCSRYGKVFKSHLFGVPTIVSGDFELNNFVLQNEDKLFRSFYPKSVKDILGKHCMMLVSGDLHKKLRTVAVSFIGTSRTNPQFLLYVHNLSISFMDSLKGCQDISFSKEAKKWFDALKEATCQPPISPIHISHAEKSLTMHIMLKNLLNIEPEEPLALKMLEDYLTYMKGLVSVPIKLPGAPFTKAFKARTRISATIKRIIEERKKEDVKVVEERGDFLDEMLLKGDYLLNNEEKISVVMDLLLAGYETTAGLLALLLYYLAQSPKALQQLKEEHLAVKKNKKEGEPLTWNEIQQMEFNSNVIYEALRCGNLVKFVHRKALEDIEFKGHYIPKGWQVLPVFTVVHLDPQFHDNPSHFNPWRWNDRSMKKLVNPFGGGNRLCPGADLAKLEATIFLHHLVLNYRWKMKEDDHPVSYPYLDFEKGLKLNIQPLEN